MQTTLIITFKVPSNASQTFANWREKMGGAVVTFPGFLSMEIVPPNLGSNEWILVQRFQSEDSLKAWKESTLLKSLIEEIQPFIEAINLQDSSSSPKEESVTEIFVTKISPSMHEAYRAWATKVQQIESKFPGYQGVYIQAPTDSDQSGNWITILRFDTHENLNNWLLSKERIAILKESETLVEEFQSHQVVGPFSGWFANFAKTTGKPPSAVKQSLVVLLVIFPIAMLEKKFLGPLLYVLIPSLQMFIELSISVILAAWPMMPFAIFCLKWWLNPECDAKHNAVGYYTIAGLYLLEILCFWKLL